MKTVKLVNSTAFLNSGEGVVANRDIPKDRIACMYSLFLYTTMEQIDIHTGNIKNRNPISTRGVSEGTPLENLVFTARFLCFFHINSKN